MNKKYEPYYKWQFKALSELSLLSHLSENFEYLITSGNCSDETILKQNVIEGICREIISLILQQGLSDYQGDNAEGHAYSVNEKIKNGDIRNLHVLYAV